MTKLERKINSILIRLGLIEAGKKLINLPPYNNGDDSWLYVSENGEDKKIKLTNVSFGGGSATIQDVAANTSAIQVNINDIASINSELSSTTVRSYANKQDISDLQGRVTQNEIDIENRRISINGLSNIVQDNEADIASLLNVVGDNMVSLVASNSVYDGFGADGGVYDRGAVIHNPNSSVLPTNKDVLIYKDIDGDISRVFIKETSSFLNRVLSHKQTQINMFNSSSETLGSETFLPKELRFSALIENTGYEGSVSIGGADYISFDIEITYNHNNLIGSQDININCLITSYHYNEIIISSIDWNGWAYIHGSASKYTTFNTTFGIGSNTFSVLGTTTGQDVKGFNITKEKDIVGLECAFELSDIAFDGVRIIVFADADSNPSNRTLLYDDVLPLNNNKINVFDLDFRALVSNSTIKVFFQKKNGDPAIGVNMIGRISLKYRN